MLYHNRELHPIPQVAREFLYARLALSLFPLLSSFLSGGSKYLRVFVRTPLGFQQKDAWVSWRDVLKERESSTPKRRRGADGAQNDEEITADSDAGFTGDTDLDDHVLAPSTSSELPLPLNPAIDSLEAIKGYFAAGSEIDEDIQHDRRLQELAFPEMGVEKVQGVGRVWDDITWYPGSGRTEQLKKLFSEDRGWVQILAGRKRSLECDDEDMARYNMQRRV